MRKKVIFGIIGCLSFCLTQLCGAQLNLGSFEYRSGQRFLGDQRLHLIDQSHAQQRLSHLD
jgi:hypothetical protein